MRPAILFLGGFKVLCRNRLYLAEARRRGLAALLITSADWRDRTLAAMASPDHPAAELAAAEFVAGQVEVEGSFTAGVVGAATDLARRWDIRGVYAVGEMMVEQTGVLADALGLPAPGLRATRACRSKYLQRLLCPKWSPPVLLFPPGNRSARHGDHPGFPAVLKPASRRSSSGVRRVGSQRELDEVLPDYPVAETLLLERYVAGAEFSVEALVQGGRVLFDSVTAKATNEATSERFVELGHSVPAAPGPTTDAVLAVNRAVLARLGFADGVAHGEYRVTPDGVVLMEIAARTPGDGILPLYHLATGEPMEPQILRIALGEPAAYPAPARVARQVYLDHRPGVLTDVRVAWPGVRPRWLSGGLWPMPVPGRPGDPPALREVLVLAGRGAQLGPLRDSDDRAVTFLIDARTRTELDALERDVRAALEVRVAEPPAPPW